MAFPIAAALSAAASIGGGLLASRSADRSADAQADASNAAIAEQRRQFDETQNLLAPFTDTAGRTNAAIAYELGLGPRPQRQGWESIPQVERIRRGGAGGNGAAPAPVNRLANPLAEQHAQMVSPGRQAPQQGGGASGGGPRFRVGSETFDNRRDAREYRREMFDDRAPEDSFDYGGFRTTPGYQFRFDEGLDAMQATLAAGGMAGSGAALKAATQYGQNVASDEYGTYFNRLAGAARQPQTAQLANAGAGMAGNVGNLLMAGGRAQAQGAANQGNIFSGTMNDLAGIAGRYFGSQAPAMQAPASMPPFSGSLPQFGGGNVFGGVPTGPSSFS